MTKATDKYLIIKTVTYQRNITSPVKVGNIAIGGDTFIRLQTMTTTNTNNVEETVNHTIRAIEAGAEMVRITTQGVREAKNLAKIKKTLHFKGYDTPLVADIHFNPTAALEAAKHADKIRINPGNFTDRSRASSPIFSESEYENDLARAEERFLELLNVCKENKVAIRIGVNHGSLSQRVMSRYGDTPEGMAQSAMEFLRICQKHNHNQLVVSMKSSNTQVMVQATRYLASMMSQEGMSYPLHLGVTEAGEGEDGRIKSAVGIGALLVDGIGDTIRVSLTEEPENEIPVARTLVKLFEGWQSKPTHFEGKVPIDPFSYNRRVTRSAGLIGGTNPPVVMANLSQVSGLSIEHLAHWGWNYRANKDAWLPEEQCADFLFIGNESPTELPCHENLPLVGSHSECRYKTISITEIGSLKSKTQDESVFLLLDAEKVDDSALEELKGNPNIIIILSVNSPYAFFQVRNTIFSLINIGVEIPVVMSFCFPQSENESFPIESAAICGGLFLDGLADGLMLSAPRVEHNVIRKTSFGILQASRVRITKTEFISCPGCGRTLFNLNYTLLRVKERTSHLKGLKIGVMGCIVNGPGEMADADYGYVGSGRNQVTLYHRREIVERNVPEQEAVDRLIELIKGNGDWVDP